MPSESVGRKGRQSTQPNEENTAARPPPQLLPELSSAGSETDLWVSEDGRYAVFERNGDIYEASR